MSDAPTSSASEKPVETQEASCGTKSDKAEKHLISEDKVIEAICTVFDPEIPVNVYDLGLIYGVDLYDDGKVEVEMSLTAPNCPSAQELPLMVKEAVETVEHVKEVNVRIIWDPPWDVSRMSDTARLALNMF